MRKNLKPKAYIYPLPVLIIGTYDENGIPNAMNAAWGTICDTKQVSIVLSATHKTVKNYLFRFLVGLIKMAHTLFYMYLLIFLRHYSLRVKNNNIFHISI